MQPTTDATSQYFKGIQKLAPIDRDPVPSRFAESVRRYYEELGKDK